MKVLLIYTNINGYHEDIFSFGLASISAMTKKHGHEVKWLTARTEDDYDTLYREASLFRPRVVGFTAVSSQFHSVLTLAEGIKKRCPDVITTCGGVHPTIAPSCLTESDYLDTIFVGEADFAFIEFLDKIEKNENYEVIDNLGYLKEGKVQVNSLKPNLPSLDVLPYADRESNPFEESIKSIGFAPFLFARGCPYACTYCSNQAIADTYGIKKNYARYRSAESSIQEIEGTLHKYPGIKHIYIGDDIFGLDKRWRNEFCEKYKKRVNIKFSCLLRPDLVNIDFIKLLKYAGCHQISLGVESGNEHVRNNIMQRHMSQQTIIKAFDLAHQHGLRTNAINIIGVPGENEEMILDTVKLNRRVKPSVSGVNIFYPYRGTKLGDYCFEKNLVDMTLFKTFSAERRESVLNYPPEFKAKLVYFRENWEELVYPHDLKRRIMKSVRKTVIWKVIRNLRNKISYGLAEANRDSLSPSG